MEKSVLFMLIFISIIIGIVLLLSLIFYLLTSIPLYQIAKRTEFKNPWLAFIPIVQHYIVFVIPQKEWTLFNGTFKSKDRSVVFWIYIGASYFGSFFIAMISFIPFVGLFSWILNIALVVAIYIVLWSFIKDFIDTFKPNDDNMAISIFSTIIPIVFIIMLWILRNNDSIYINKSIDNEKIKKSNSDTCDQNPYM